MKPVLILQHQTAEHPAYLETWLQQHSIDYEIRNADCELFPASIEPYSALAVLGGGMSVNDPLLSNRQAEILILQSVLRGIPVVGHCLGGQLMTRALGGTVGTADRPEIGWQPIEYLDHPDSRAWFGDSPTPLVAQWHYETFSIPPGATLLASSEACRNQAWSMGPHLAMQFHIEIDARKAREWAADEDPKWALARDSFDTVQNSTEIIAGIEPNLAQHQATADNIYQNWLKTTGWAAKLSTNL